MKKVLPILLIVLALFYVAVAVYYWVTPANSLMHFMPGYDATSDQPHIKHGLASLALAVACGALAWFLGSKSSHSDGPTLPSQQ